MSGGGNENGRDRVRGGDLPPSEIDRMFDLLEEAIEAETLTDDQVDRLLAILRAATDGATGSDPETLAELLSVLERFLLDPESRDDVDIDSFLGLFEDAVVSPTDQGALTELLEVVDQGLQDPTGVEPEDVDRFQSGVQRLLSEIADPAGGLGALLNAESPAELLTTTRAITLDELRRAGIDIGESQSRWLDTHREKAVEDRPLTRDALAERGARLISQSAEVGRDESVHPAFGSIIRQLSTDEVRILRVLAVDGPQGVVDIYDRQYLPPKKWRVARNLTMLGRDAGCRTQRRTPVYVRNLRRLGVVEISEDPIDELKRYEVIEAQSHVEQARTRAKRPRTEYKRLQLTDLGVEFCELCFPFEVTVTGEGLQVRENAGVEP